MWGVTMSAVNVEGHEEQDQQATTKACVDRGLRHAN